MYLLLFPIRLYWLLLPAHRRRTCIFKKSCSHFVYDNTIKNGFFAGLRALWYRYKNCRSGYALFINSHSGKVEMILPGKDIIDSNEISDAVLNRFNTVA